MKHLLTLAFFVCCFFSLDTKADNPGDGYTIGDIASDFKLKNIDQQMVSLSDYKDAKGFIVIFTGYPVIAINPNDPEIKAGDSFEEMQKRAKDKNFEFPYLLDEEQTVFPKYGAKKTPHVYILDSERIVKYIGAIDDSPADPDAVDINYVDNAIMAIRKGENPIPATTKAIGCSIKSKRTKKARKSRT